MNRLVREHGIEAQISSCTQRRIRQEQDLNHEQFCCKKDFVLLTDSKDEEIAIVMEQIHADRGKGITKTFVQIRAGSTVYRLRLP